MGGRRREIQNQSNVVPWEIKEKFSERTKNGGADNEKKQKENERQKEKDR